MTRYGRIARYTRLAVDEMLHLAASSLSVRLRRPLVRPLQVNWVMTYECNFDCAMCNERKMQQPADPLTLDEIRSVIDQMSAWGIRRLGFSGGEPLLKKELLLEAVRHAGRKGIYTRIVTNGSLLDRDFLEAFSRLRGGHLILSLDGSEALHDSIRTSGSYGKIVEALDTIASLEPGGIVVRINAVLSARNLDSIIDAVDLCDRYGHIMWIQPYRFDLGNAASGALHEIPSSDPFWPAPGDLPRLDRLIRRLKEINREKPGLLLNDSRHLDRIHDYFALERRENRCLVGYQRMKISPDGKVFWCVSRVGDVRTQTLKEIWRSTEATKERERNLRCSRPCEWGCPYQPSLIALAKKIQVIRRSSRRRRRD